MSRVAPEEMSQSWTNIVKRVKLSTDFAKTGAGTNLNTGIKKMKVPKIDDERDGVWRGVIKNLKITLSAQKSL